MASTFKWLAAEATATALSTGLNSLTTGSSPTASSTIANSTDLYERIALELVLASLTPTGTPSVDIYLLKSLDGTNFEDLSASSPAGFLYSFGISTATGAKRAVIAGLEIPPFDFKLTLISNTGVTLAASGNTLKYRRYYEQAV